MSFPKHEWLRAVARDKGLDDSYARVAMDLSTSTSVEDGTFCVRQKTVAERMGRDVRSVKRAYAALKNAGYIEWVAAGKRGRGYFSGDTWRLQFPQVGSGDAIVTTSGSGDDSSPEVVTRSAVSGDDSSPEVVTTQAADFPSTSGDVVPVVLFVGLNEGLQGGAGPAEREPFAAEVDPGSDDAPTPSGFLEENTQPLDVEEVEPVSREVVAQSIAAGINPMIAQVVDDDPDLEPPAYCGRHLPDGTDVACGACRNRRIVHERWERGRPARGASKLRAWATLALEERERETQPAVAIAARKRGAAEPARPLPKPEPPSWVLGPDGRPHCRRHGHLPTAPADCTQCDDAAIAAEESA